MKIKLELFPEQLRLVDKGEHWNQSSKYALRKDVYIPATLNGLNAEIHLMTSDGSIKENKDKWYCSFECNKSKTYERCSKCHTQVGPLLAIELFPKLKKMGYPIAVWHDNGFWTFSVFADSVESLPDKNSRRQFFYKKVDRIVCPIHGKFVQETEESVF